MLARLRVRDEEGASAVEFALIASLLLMIVFGTIQFGIAYNRVQGLNSAGREGARAASIGVPIGDVVARVRSAQSLFRPLDVDVDIEYSSNDGATWTNVCSACDVNETDKPCTGACIVGNVIRVTGRVSNVDPVGRRYAIAIPLVAMFRVNYRGTGTFRIEKT